MRRRPGVHDEAPDAGQAGLEAVLFGVLVFVLGTLLVVNAWGVVDAKLAASSAAREAARSYVEAPSPQAADGDARRAAEEAIAGHGRDGSRLELQLLDGRFARCARVTFEARYHVPLVAVPLLGQHGRGTVVSARHSEVVDPYRSGPAGTAVCDGG
ncbi:MAG TPA: hypothetical protein VHE80_09935 [Acidimicrobiales bacterium]|nr:hypothetical protein [Acidimicrobiales bacterium]